MSARRQIRRRVVNTVSKVFIILQWLGARTGRAQILTTVGRQSGKSRRTPVGVVTIDRQRYIFQAYPRSAWVANVRARCEATLSTGRLAQRVRLIEVDVEQRRALLLRQLTAEPDTGALYLGLISAGVVLRAFGLVDSVSAGQTVNAILQATSIVASGCSIALLLTPLARRYFRGSPIPTRISRG